MAYLLNLTLEGKENTYTRNGEPNLRDMTNAMKVQQQQLRMYAKDGGPTNADFDTNESNLANFAVSFWQGAFRKDDVIDGANLASLDAINAAINDSLKDDESAPDEKPVKKSPTRTSKKPSTVSTSSTKQD